MYPEMLVEIVAAGELLFASGLIADVRFLERVKRSCVSFQVFRATETFFASENVADKDLVWIRWYNRGCLCRRSLSLLWARFSGRATGCRRL